MQLECKTSFFRQSTGVSHAVDGDRKLFGFLRRSGINVGFAEFVVLIKIIGNRISGSPDLVALPTVEADILSGAVDYFRRYHARTLSKAKLSEEIFRSVRELKHSLHIVRS